jgi:cell division protein FtsL
MTTFSGDQALTPLRRDIKLLQEKTEKQEKEIEELKKQVAALTRKVGN